jgi:integrase
MSAIMTHAAKRRLCDKPAFERPSQPRGRVRWITFQEADRLIAGCAPHLAPLVTFMLFTGCRVGEALALDWRDVDLSRAHASFLDTKNGDRRGTPLHPRAVAALAGLSHRAGVVFRRPDKRPYAPKDDGGGHSPAPAGELLLRISIRTTADTHGPRGTMRQTVTLAR